jgi:hypothetical protein
MTYDPATNRPYGINFDANGNQAVGTWDIENRLVQQTLDGKQITWGYDPSNKRVMRYEPSVNGQPQWTFYAYGPGGERLAEITCAATGVCTSAGSNVYFGGKLIAGPGGQGVVTDRLGSVRARQEGGTWTSLSYYPWGQEKTPYAPDGIVTDELKEMLLGNSFEVYREDLQRGAKDEDNLGEVYRLQRRLAALWYIDSGIDGDFGAGTEVGLKYFQKRNNLVETGIADEVTQRLLFSANAVKSDRPEHPYLLKVSIKDQRVYAYKWANGGYSKLVRTMKCSSGLGDTPTPRGTYSNGGPAGRWYYFNKFDVWAQYAYRISGPYLFHSVLFNDRDSSTVISGSVAKLGSRASHGCIRLKVEDAKWIYNNVSARTTVTIY